MNPCARYPAEREDSYLGRIKRSNFSAAAVAGRSPLIIKRSLQKAVPEEGAAVSRLPSPVAPRAPSRVHRGNLAAIASRSRCAATPATLFLLAEFLRSSNMPLSLVTQVLATNREISSHIAHGLCRDVIMFPSPVKPEAVWARVAGRGSLQPTVAGDSGSATRG